MSKKTKGIGATSNKNSHDFKGLNIYRDFLRRFHANEKKCYNGNTKNENILLSVNSKLMCFLITYTKMTVLAGFLAPIPDIIYSFVPTSTIKI